LLGGIYYIVLHGSVDTSVVCGRDIKLERDRQILEKTIKQIIGWAWKETEKTGFKQINSITMNNDLEKLINQGKSCLESNENEQWKLFERGLPFTLKSLESSLTEQLMNLT